MAALDENPFEDLLVSRSVFVSPLTAAADRYDNQPDNPDDLDKNSWEIEDTEPYNLGEATQWQWTEPRESIAGSDHLGEKDYVDHEDNISQEPMPQEDHNAASPYRPPKEEDEVSFAWEKHDDERGGCGEKGEKNAPDETDVHFDKVDNDSTSSIRSNAGQDLESPRTRQATGSERANKVDDIDDVNQCDSPLPVAPQVTSFSGSHSFEDQPIRGLTTGREMSLDELIAQGERQMQEAQAKTAAAKVPRGRGGGAAGRGAKNAISSVHQRSDVAVAIPAIMERRNPGSGENRPDKASDIHPSGPRMGQSPEPPGPTAKQGFQLSPESPTNRGGVDMGGEGECGGADEGGSRIHGSNSLRNASFATSWSCGDAEQQLRHLSMGVSPALGARDPAYKREAESRSERERREFYELEMELLREEQEGEAVRGRGGQQTVPRGQDPEGDDNFWDNEDQSGSYEARGTHERDDPADDLGIESEIPSEGRCRRNPESGHGSGRTHVNGPDNYRQLAGQTNGGAKATVGSTHMPPKSLKGNTKGEMTSLAGRDDWQDVVEGHRGQRYNIGDGNHDDFNTNERPHMNGQDYDDEDETRRWEEAGGDEEESEGRGREQSARFNPSIPGFEGTDYPPSGAPTVPRRRATFHSANNTNVLSEDDCFDDARTLRGARTALEAVEDIPNPNARGHWSRPADSPSSLAPQRGEDRRGVPSQSKLVQRVFGGRGGRGRGVSGRTKVSGHGQGGGRGRGATRDREEQREDRAESWAVQAELEGKLRELEDEIARYKEENKRALLARRKQETAVAEIMKRRQEVREWAEAERAAVEAWCSEQRQAAAREKRVVMKQIQGLRARAQAGGASGTGTATERRQRQEIEALKATIEKAKLDAEAARKKARASERRLQQQIKSGADRIAELEGQVSFLERQRVDVWASTTGGLTTSSRPQKGNTVGLSASVGAGVGKEEREAFSARVIDVDGPAEKCREGQTDSVAAERPASSRGFSGWAGEEQGCDDANERGVLRREDDVGTVTEEPWEDEEIATVGRREVGRRRNVDITGNGGFVREGGVVTAEDKRGRGLEDDWPTSTSGRYNGGATRGNVSDVGSVDERHFEEDRMRWEGSRMSSSGQRLRGERQSHGLGDRDGERPASRTDPRFRPSAAVAPYEDSEGFSSSGQWGRRRSPSLDPQQQPVGVNDCDRGFCGDARGQKSPGQLMEERMGPPEERHGAWELNRGGRPRTSGGVKYDPMRYETSAAVVAQEHAQPQTIDRRRENRQSPCATVGQTSLVFPRSVNSDSGGVGTGGSGGHGREEKQEETRAPGAVSDGRFRRDTGGKVEHILKDGRRIVLFANGTQKETLPDGGCVVRFMNGDLKRVEGKTGVVVYTYAAAQTVHTMHPSGLEVFQFPNGQVERHHKSGEKEISFPDGTRKTIFTCGREMSEFSDGVTVMEYPEGYRDVTSPEGTSHREYPDGTVASLPSRSLQKVRSASSVSRAAESRDSSGGSAVGARVSNQVGETFVRDLRRSRSGW